MWAPSELDKGGKAGSWFQPATVQEGRARLPERGVAALSRERNCKKLLGTLGKVARLWGGPPSDYSIFLSFLFFPFFPCCGNVSGWRVGVQPRC